MLLRLMDGKSQMQRSWQEPDSSRLATSMRSSPEQRQIPDIATALDDNLPITTDHRLPPIATNFHAYVSQPQDVNAAAALGSISSSQATSPLRSPGARPKKRPRWHWSQGSTSTFSAPPDGHSDDQEYSRTRETRAWANPENAQFSQRQESSCSNCADTNALVARVVSGLLSLEDDIRHALTLSTAGRNISRSEITKSGLRHSLTFVSHCIEANSRLVREVAATRSDQAPLAAGVAKDTGPGSQPGNFNITTEVTEQHRSKRRASLVEDHLAAGSISTIQALPPPSFDNLAHSPLFARTDTMKRTYHVEPPPAKAVQSPRGSPPISTFASGHSPAHSQPSSRTLPSPSSYMPYPSSASSIPSSYGDPALSAAQASHIQDLQHQISTKTLALQTLQREHDQLLAAFSRSQIRCTTLDKKSQVSEHEINSLSEEKARLQQHVEALEGQVEELARAKDEAQLQLAADGAQWQRIMAMSSQLQIRSADETRQHRADKDAWERDREGLQRRIQDLEAGTLNMGPSQASDGTTPISIDAVLASTSLDTLREEILRLRRSCVEMESLLRDIQGESEHMGPTLATLTNINERISALSTQTRSDAVTTLEPEKSSRAAEGG